MALPQLLTRQPGANSATAREMSISGAARLRRGRSSKPRGDHGGATRNRLHAADRTRRRFLGPTRTATIVNGGITVIAPTGEVIEHHATDDVLTTNLCFGGADLRTAFVTLSSTGRLVSFPWPRPGLALEF